MNILLLLSIYFISCYHSAQGITSADLNRRICSSCNDPHFLTFDQKRYDFHIQGDNYILFTNYLDTRVTGSFRRCNPNQAKPQCNCGVQISYKDALIFLDTCGTIPTTGLKLVYASSPNYVPVDALCGSKLIPPGKEMVDSWWDTPGSAVNILGNKFLCAKTKYSNTLIVRTNNGNNANNIYVRLDLNARGITCTSIRPSLNSFNNTGGLCGNFNSNPNDDLFVWKLTGTPDGSVNGGYTQKPANVTDLANFWILDRCAPGELDYKKLDSSICICDNTTATTTTGCVNPLAKCVSNAFGTPFIPSDGVRPVDAVPSDINTATNVVNNYLNELKINDAVTAGLITQDYLNDQTINVLIPDQMDTSDAFFLISTIEVIVAKILENCGENSTDPLCQFFANNPVTCLVPGFRSIVGDSGPLPSCPRPPACPAKRR